MRKLLWMVWCLLPVGGAAYHFGPGQEQLVLDEAGSTARAAREQARIAARLEGEKASARWVKAVKLFDQALEVLPAGHDEERARLTLERAKARMLSSELPAANAELETLVDDLARDPATDPELLRDARRTWASSQYYMTWLERLEGVPREEWEPRIDSARQTYKLLATSEELPDDERLAVQEDLEAAIRLARMDLGELQGLPLPSQ